jgi:hypothetical protein
MKIDPTYLNILRQIYTRLKDSNINWVVTGSFGFALQNVPVTSQDIDLQTNEAGAYEIERLLSEYVTRNVAFSSAENIRSHFGALTIDGIKVEIMGDIAKRLEDGTWEEPVDLERYKQSVEVEGMQIPVLSLEYEYQAYLKLGRLEKAQILRKVLRPGAVGTPACHPSP